jgi:hypothetical protein
MQLLHTTNCTWSWSYKQELFLQVRDLTVTFTECIPTHNTRQDNMVGSHTLLSPWNRVVVQQNPGQCNTKSWGMWHCVNGNCSCILKNCKAFFWRVRDEGTVCFQNVGNYLRNTVPQHRCLVSSVTMLLEPVCLTNHNETRACVCGYGDCCPHLLPTHLVSCFISQSQVSVKQRSLEPQKAASPLNNTFAPHHSNVKPKYWTLWSHHKLLPVYREGQKAKNFSLQVNKP